MQAPDDAHGYQSRQQPDDDKLRELILYISWVSERDPAFGETKLVKLLFNADFRAYKLFGQSITGHEYRRLEFGPAPGALPAVREALEAEGAMIVREQDFYGWPQWRTIALRPPRIDLFTAQEIALVDQIIDEWRGVTATETSQASHAFVGWKLALPGEVIPYEAVLFEPHEARDAERALAPQLTEEAQAALTEPHG